MVDYIVGRATYLETVPLCHYCHSYIHRGRLEAILEAKEITQAKYVAIVQHGDAILRQAKLIKPAQHGGGDVAWVKWRMIIDGKEYKPKIRSLKAWKKKFNAKNRP
jgi:glycerol-3-phosphate cytidylyltransferase-like family protein